MFNRKGGEDMAEQYHSVNKNQFVIMAAHMPDRKSARVYGGKCGLHIAQKILVDDDIPEDARHYAIQHMREAEAEEICEAVKDPRFGEFLGYLLRHDTQVPRAELLAEITSRFV